MENIWTVEDVRNDFAAIAQAAYAGEPQYVTNHSQPDLVILTKSSFDQIKQQERGENRQFVEFLISGPKGDIFPEGYTPSDLCSREVDF